MKVIVTVAPAWSEKACCWSASQIGRSYETPPAFAQTLARLDPSLVLVHVSGSHTDGSEQGKIIRARVEGKAENALLRLSLRAVHDMRPSLMKPVLGPRNVKASYRMMLLFYRATNLLLPGLGSSQAARAMLRCAREGAPQRVLEPADIAALAAGVRGFFHPPVSLRRVQLQQRLDQRASVG